MSKLFDKLMVGRLFTWVLVLCTWVGYTSCSEQDEELGVEYGYVQFKLYKNNTAPAQSTTRATSLEYLYDAHKVKVSMVRDGLSIEQTLVLNSHNSDNAEYGLRSDKLQLLAGEYNVIGYTLYDLSLIHI